MSLALVEMLGELARLGVPRISLTGLTVEGAGRLLARLTGRRLATRVVRQIHARTGGNPFFVTEMATVDIRDPRAIPVNVRMAISKRLDRLSALANRVLSVAAVVGREFDFPLLRAALSDIDEEALLRAIDEGLKTLVIEPLPSRGAEWYQFTHALIRDAVYENISPSRRARWHATIARALETLLGDTVDDRAAELAQNAACAGALIEPAILAKYSRIAGERLLNVHAFPEALSHFERAWRAREGLVLDAMAAATLVGLGLAQAATAVRWNRQQGWTTLRHAIDYGRRRCHRGRKIRSASRTSRRRARRWTQYSMGRLNHFGGAMSRIADDATPFPHRKALFAFSPEGMWNRPEEADASVQWAKGCWQALRAYSPRGA